MSYIDLSASLQVTTSEEDVHGQLPPRGGARSADGNRTSRPPIVMIASPFPTILSANADASSGLQLSGALNSMPGSPVLNGPSPVPSREMCRRKKSDVKPVAQKKPSASSVPVHRTPSGGLFLSAGSFEVTPAGDLHIRGAFTGQLGSPHHEAAKQIESRPAATRERRKSDVSHVPAPAWATMSKVSVKSAGSSLSLSSQRSSSSSLGAKSPSSGGKKGAKDTAIPQDGLLQALAVSVAKPKHSAKSSHSQKSLSSQQNASPNQMNFLIHIPQAQGSTADSVTITVINEPNAN